MWMCRGTRPEPRRELANGVGGESIFMDGMKREIWNDREPDICVQVESDEGGTTLIHILVTGHPYLLRNAIYKNC